MRGHAETLLKDVVARADSPEASVAHRMAGVTHWFAGEYLGAREHLERALALFQPGRDDELALRFGQDPGVAAMLFLALTLWPLDELECAAALVRSAEARTAGLTYFGTHAYAHTHAAMFELMSGDLSRVETRGPELARIAHRHDLAR